MEAENLKIILNEFRDGVEGRVRAEQESERLKLLYQQSECTNAEKDEVIEKQRDEIQRQAEVIESLRTQVSQLQNNLSFFLGANTMAQLTNLICLNSQKFVLALTTFAQKSEILFTTIGIVEQSLCDGAPKESFDEAKTLVYKEAGKDESHNKYTFQSGSQTTIYTNAPKEQ